MLVKCYEHLHPLPFASSITSQSNPMDIDVRCSLDILKMVDSNIELTKERITQEILQFKRFMLMLKTSNALYSGGRNMKLCYVRWVCLHDKF
jgi:hypothetical protein